MSQTSRVTLWRDRRLHSFIVQALFLATLGFLIYFAFANALVNMRAHGIPTDEQFLDHVSGFDINQTLIAYSATSTYRRAFYVGLLNTLSVAAIGIGLSTFLGLAIGIARLSRNGLAARAATVYVETIRNIPLLLQLLFWYNAVLSTLPAPRQSLSFWGVAFINLRGVYVPAPIWSEGLIRTLASALIALVCACLYGLYARSRRLRYGEAPRFSSFIIAILAIALPLLTYVLNASDVHFSIPQLKGLNFTGGMKLFPEFVALLLGLVLYTAAFIAEIVRAGILAVPKGQTEAALALGLSSSQMRRYVIIPQAMRLIVPPLTSQYLNLLKNSSLAVFIGYPDLVQVFMGTVLNQTGAAVQIIGQTMLVYLSISLLVSLAMNFYNRRLAFVGR